MCLSLVIATWTLAPPAHAYLDPGTGNAILQGIIGALAVATGFVTYHWQRLRLLFSSKDERDETRKSSRGE